MKPKSKPVTLSVYPVKLFAADGSAVECLQYCRDDERPLSNNWQPDASFNGIEQAMRHYASACALLNHVRPAAQVPLLLLSATVE